MAYTFTTRILTWIVDCDEFLARSKFLHNRGGKGLQKIKRRENRFSSCVAVWQNIEESSEKIMERSVRERRRRRRKRENHNKRGT